MSSKLNARKFHSQKTNGGFALFEALISLLIIALGLLAIVGLQLKTLADTQVAVKRSQAIDLVNQLSERMRTNPSSINNASDYLIAQGSTPTIAKDCKSNACSASEMAQYEVNSWLADVKKIMPMGDAAVFLPADYPSGYTGLTTQLGILISWRVNDRSKPDGSVDTDYSTPLKVDTGFSGGTAAQCPSDRICHLQFIPLNSRCTPYSKSGSSKYYCAG